MGRRGRGDGSVYQRKDGSWVAQFQGKYRYAQTKDAAKQKLYKMLTNTEESKPETITVGKLLDEYISAATPNLKPRTVKRYREGINLHLKPSLGKVKLHALDALTIEGVYSRKLADGVSPSTIQLINAVLSSAMKRAIRLKLVTHNPCRDVVLPRVEREEVEVFDPSEVHAILTAAEYDSLEALWVLALSTGTPILSYLWATYSDAYLYYGRAYFLVYLGCLLGLTGLFAQRRERRLEGENWGFGLTFVGVALGLIGDVLAYWGGPPGQGFTQLQGTGFSIEMLGLLLVLIGSVVLGVAYHRTNVLPRLVPWLLIAAGPGGILFSILHAPSGTLLVFCCAWVVLGLLLLRGKVSSAERPSHVS